MDNRKKILFVSSEVMFQTFVPVLYPGGGFIDKHHYFTDEFDILRVELYGSTAGRRVQSVIVFMTDSREASSERFRLYMEQSLRTCLSVGHTQNLVVL